MQSVIIAAKEEKTRDDYVQKICREFHVNIFDITSIASEKSIGIEDIRRLKKTLYLAPIKGTAKACIIKNAHSMTTEAQNALLKVLEEPPVNTIIILAAENKHVFLPTILSRCKIVELSTLEDTLKSDELLTVKSQLSIVLKGGIGPRLRLAQDVAKNKKETLTWLENTILATHQYLIATLVNESNALQRFNDLNHFSKRGLSISQYFTVLISFQKTHVVLKTTNANPRLSLENLFLNL